jgi:tetratricopeptide (TPR) repeat protein
MRLPSAMSRRARSMRLRSLLLVPLLAACCLPSAVLAAPIDYDPRRATELRACDEPQHRGRVQEARLCYRRLLENSGNVITQAEAAWALGDIQRANSLFREAANANERSSQPRVRWGRLFLYTHQHAEALELFKEALQRSQSDVYAKLGMAHVFAERFEGQARTLVEEVLKQDDTLIDAYLLRARMDLEEGRLEDVAKTLDRAQQLAERQRQPLLEVFTLRAVLEQLRQGRRRDDWIDRALAYNPRYGGIFEQLAHFEVMRRRYREATALLKRAVEVQPDLWSAHAELGANLLREGDFAQARAHLTSAYSGDPYSATTVNTLRLLDRVDDFDVTSKTITVPALSGGERTAEVRLRLDRKEAEALRPYVLKLAADSIAAFSRRYQFEPREPITLELYPQHDDFAVRVAALPGIGLLGVTFGYLVAMDSPSGRPTGEFHWGSTLWHEMAHVFTLEATDHRVPRWLSEGISADRGPGLGIHSPEIPGAGAGVLHAGGPRLPVHRAAFRLRQARRAAEAVHEGDDDEGRRRGHVQDQERGVRQAVRCVRARALQGIARGHARLAVALSGCGEGGRGIALERCDRAGAQGDRALSRAQRTRRGLSAARARARQIGRSGAGAADAARLSQGRRLGSRGAAGSRDVAR